MPEFVSKILIDNAYREAIGAKERLDQKYQDEKLVVMNGLAWAIAKNGPTTNLGAFLFAMHGEQLIKGKKEVPSDAQQAYQNMQKTFGLNTLETIFTSSIERSAPPYEPFVNLAPRPLLHRQMESDAFGDFSAVYFDIEPTAKNRFEGSAFVPTVQQNWDRGGDFKWGYVTLAEVRRHSTQNFAYVPEFDPERISFGANIISPFAHRDDPAGLDEELTKVLRTEEALRNFADREEMPQALSPYR